MASEPNIAAAWLYSTLAGDVTLAGLVGTRIYEDIRPANVSTFPYIVFQLQSPGSDLMVVGTARVWVPLLYTVRGIAQGRSYGGNLASIADRIDALLHGKQADVSGGRVQSYRERPFRLPERTSEIDYRHLGGEYRILTQAT